jgi:hypothetical protein
MRYRFVAAERASHPVRLLCRVLGVAASGFYVWLQRKPSRREQQDRRLADRIAAVFAASRRTYGSPRVHADLRAEGIRVSRKRVTRMMRAAEPVSGIASFRFPGSQRHRYEQLARLPEELIALGDTIGCSWPCGRTWRR